MPRNPPSLRLEEGSIIPIGFVNAPDAAHIERSQKVLKDVSQAFSPIGGSDARRPLSVILSHFRHNHLLSPQLFGFAVHEFDSEGRQVDAIGEGRPIRFAVNLSLPVELQREQALLYLAQLIARQDGDGDGDERSIAEIDREKADRDTWANDVVVDALRLGWGHAARVISAFSLERGWDLDVTYAADPLPTHGSVLARRDMLRLAYNSIDDLRLVIDRFVSLLSIRDRSRIGGGPELTRQWLQRNSLVLNWSEYLSQAVRDAQVYGNGYVRFIGTPTPRMHNLDPADVRIGSDGSYTIGPVEPQVRLPSDQVMHHIGIGQVDSPYGLSLLEPILASFLALRTITDGLRQVRESLHGTVPTPDQESWLTETEALATRTSETFGQTISNTYFLPLQ